MHCNVAFKFNSPRFHWTCKLARLSALARGVGGYLKPNRASTLVSSEGWDCPSDSPTLEKYILASGLRQVMLLYRYYHSYD